MAVYHQMGHDSQNLLAEEDLHRFRGAILSPVNYPEQKVAQQIETFKTDKFETIFDPQLYFPNSERGQLPNWSYFPSDVDTADQSSIHWWQKIINDLIEVAKRNNPSSICSPVVVPRLYPNDYYKLNLEIYDKLLKGLQGEDTDVLLTVLANLKDLSSLDRSAEIASIISKISVNRVYLIFITDTIPRRELNETEDIKGAMRLISYLENAKIQVLVGFASTDILLWKTAGASHCASGKFYNLRRFSPSRWSEESRGVGQLSYWFEERLSNIFSVNSSILEH